MRFKQFPAISFNMLILMPAGSATESTEIAKPEERVLRNSCYKFYLIFLRERDVERRRRGRRTDVCLLKLKTYCVIHFANAVVYNRRGSGVSNREVLQETTDFVDRMLTIDCSPCGTSSGPRVGYSRRVSLPARVLPFLCAMCLNEGALHDDDHR